MLAKELKEQPGTSAKVLRTSAKLSERQLRTRRCKKWQRRPVRAL